MRVEQGYEPLAEVLQLALDQSQAGKGKDRHANDKPVLQQPIMEIGRMVGPGYNIGQAMKKGQEAMRLPAQRAQAELLGAINYLAAAYLLVEEQIPLADRNRPTRAAYANEAAAPVKEQREPFTFPPAKKFLSGYSGEQYIAKLREEIDEVATEANRFNNTQNGSIPALLMEAWDVIHVAESYIRAICNTHKIDPTISHSATIEKNKARHYYDAGKPTELTSCAGMQCHMCETDECAVEKEKEQAPHDGMCTSCDISDAACATIRDKSKPCSYYRPR